MSHRRIVVVVLFALAVVLLPWTASAQDGGGLAGVWLRQGGGGGPVTQWMSAVPPFTPEGQAAFDANLPGKGPRQAPPAFGNDPLGGANPPGLYRALVYGRPFETIVLPDKVVQIFEWSKFWRIIWTDGRDVPADVPAGPYWYGYSVGRWEGDTLVVETLGLDGRAWLDEWGTPFTDNMRVEERWRLVEDGTVELVLTFNDPEYYTEPWSSDPRTYRPQAPDSPNGELLEVIFAPIDELFFNENIRDPAGGKTN